MENTSFKGTKLVDDPIPRIAHHKVITNRTVNQNY
jgi:hypothetical protein